MKVGDKVKIKRARVPLNLGKVGEIVKVLNDLDGYDFYVKFEEPIWTSKAMGATAWVQSSFAYFTSKQITLV